MADWKASVGEKGKTGEKGAEGLTVGIGEREREEEEQEEKRDSRNGSIIRFGVVRLVEEHWSRNSRRFGGDSRMALASQPSTSLILGWWMLRALAELGCPWLPSPPACPLGKMRDDENLGC